MSAAACKTILCSDGARASVLDYAIIHEHEGTATLELKRIINQVVWRLATSNEVIHLLAEQKFKIERNDVYRLVAAMDRIERELTPELDIEGAIRLLTTSAAALKDGILHLHLSVTGESADYDVHG